MSGSRQPSWSKQEAALLLEGFLDIKDHGLNRGFVISRVSQDLRKMAINSGIEIDEQYRNTNGIAFQIRSMESAYLGYTVFKPATKLFTEVAELFKTDFPQYIKVLEEAKMMIAESRTVEADFMQYLAEKTSPAQSASMTWLFAEIEAFCIKIKILQKPLFQTTDLDVIKKVQRNIEQNKIFRVTHRKQFNKIVSAGRYYLTYIQEGRAELCVADAPKTESVEVEIPNISEEALVVTPPMVSNELIINTEQDKRLDQKYPIIYKRILDALRTKTQNQDNGASINEIAEAIQRIARPATIEEILDNVSWARIVGNSYIFSMESEPIEIDSIEIQTQVEIPAEGVEDEDSIDFTQSNNLAYTKPSHFFYFGDEQFCGKSWADLYVSFVKTLIEDYPHVFKVGMSFSKGNGRIEFDDAVNAAKMVAPKHIPGTDYVIETNISASNMASKMGYILDLCGVDYENVVIHFTRRKPEVETRSTTEDTAGKNSQPTSRLQTSAFASYLKNQMGMAEATCRSYASAITNCENFAKEHGFSSWQLYTTEQDTVRRTISQLLESTEFAEYNIKQHNRFRAALNKYLQFIGTDNTQLSLNMPIQPQTEIYKNEKYASVLAENFRKGFRMESALEIRKFRRYYTAMHNEELLDTDEQLTENMRRLCLVYDGKAFLPEQMLSESLKNDLLQYIKDSFDNGKKAIYYQALFNEFSEAFLDYHIHDAEMLKVYLQHSELENVFFNRSFISNEVNVEIDPLSEIRDCLQEYARPVEYEELFSVLPHLPANKIKFILASNAEFVSNGRGAYFHESAVVLSEEELDNIAEIIAFAIESNEFVGGNELYGAIKSKYPYIIESNHLFSVHGFRDALKYKLGDRFSFKGNIISRAGQELSMADVFANYAKHHDCFTLTELQSLASDLDTVIYFETVYENSLRISKEEFVSKDQAQFAVEETDAALDRVCTGNYISIQEVANFGIFPYAGFPWNSFLLEHYVARYSRKYMLLHSNYNGTECAGAIVKRSAGIENFDDFIVALLANNTVELKKASALQFLSDMGYLARRRYANIESLLIRANAQRNRKDTD